MSHPPPERLLDRLFDAWAAAMLRHRAVVVAVSVLLTIGFGAAAAGLPLMTSLHDFLPENGRGMREWLEARDRFGGDEVALIAVEAEDHFTEAGLARARRIHDALLAHPFVERVVSIVDAQRMRADPEDPGTLRIDAHLDAGDPAAVRASVLADEWLRGALVSEDGRSLMFVAQMVPNRDDVARRPEIAAAVEARTRGLPGVEVQRRHEGGERRILEIAKQSVATELVALIEGEGVRAEQISAVGFVVLMSHLLDSAQRNMRVLFPLTLLLIGLSLFWTMRRLVDSLLPLVCVGPAIVWAVGLGGLIFGRLSIMTSLVPVMVLVVGVSDTVHLVTQFRHEVARGIEREAAIRLAFRQVGAACVLTSLTTLVGFGSMLLLPLPPSRELGVFAALGVSTAFLSAFMLTPVLLSFVRIDPQRTSLRAHDDLSGALRGVAALVRARAKAIVILGFVLTAVVAAGMSQVRIENAVTRKLAADHPARISVERIERALGGSADLEVLVDAGAPDGLRDPVLQAALRRVEEWIEAHPRLTRATSITDLLARMHGILEPGGGALPATPEAIAQYLLLFEMSGGEDLEALVDPTLQHARIVVRADDMSAEDLLLIAEALDAEAERLVPAPATARANGLTVQSARLGPIFVHDSIEGFGGAVLLIALLMAALFRSLKVGFLSLVPNVLPVGIGLYLASLVFEQIDIDSLTTLAIAIGIAVDDTIHFLARYRIERTRGLDIGAAVDATIAEAGHGMTRTTVILVAGFGVLMLSDYVPVRTMGVMLVLTLSSALAFDLLLVPAMARLGWFDPRGRAA